LSENQENLTFESAFEKLNELTASLESGELTLKEMVAGFEEAVKYSRFCLEQLEQAEHRVVKISESEGRIEETPLD
jgi:exodeoxyribonuclease VII small subunit